MAKGRRLTTSRSERFFGSYSNGHNQRDTITDETELGEEDVWSMVDNIADRDDQSFNNSQTEWRPRAETESNGNGNGNLDLRGGRHRIPRDDRHVGGLSLPLEESSSTKPRIVHQFRGHDGVGAAASSRGHHMATVDSVETIHDSDDGELELVPPHEYLAREYARSKQTGGASIFEGVGRTLKGRDMRRVRDAVWSQTGFDG
ncbi:hypothetical protein CRYUN_Cryun34aG0012700 [Craigia yunnanensis]